YVKRLRPWSERPPPQRRAARFSALRDAVVIKTGYIRRLSGHGRPDAAALRIRARRARPGGFAKTGFAEPARPGRSRRLYSDPTPDAAGRDPSRGNTRCPFAAWRSRAPWWRRCPVSRPSRRP